MTFSPESQAAARGAAFLDERVPGWEERIDLERLDVADGFDCILGQLFGDCRLGADALAGDHWGQLTGRGFTIPADRDDYPALTAAWREEVLARRSAGGTGC